METLRISGNISRDAVVRTIKDKDYYCFGLACERGKDKTLFYSVNLRKFGDKDMSQYLKKGAVLDVEGEPSYEVYEGKAQVTLWGTRHSILKFAQKKDDDLPPDNEAF